MIFTQLALKIPTNQSSNVYRSTYTKYSNVQVLNSILTALIDQADEESIEELSRELTRICQNEREILDVNLLCIGIAVEHEDNFERSLTIDYRNIGFSSIKEYLIWYLVGREISEIHDLLENYVKVTLNERGVIWKKSENNISDLAYKISGVSSIFNKYFSGYEATVALILKIGGLIRNLFVHKNGVADVDFVNKFGSYREEMDVINRGMNVFIKGIASNIDKFDEECDYDIFPKPVNGLALLIGNAYLNSYRTLALKIIEMDECQIEIKNSVP